MQAVDMQWLQAEIQQQAAMLQNVSGLADEVWLVAPSYARCFCLHLPWHTSQLTVILVMAGGIPCSSTGRQPGEGYPP